jgi:hypothetical protein
MCLILNGYRERALAITRPNSVRFLFMGFNEEWSLQGKADTQVQLVVHILDAAAAGMKKSEDQLRQTAHDPAHEFKVYWGWQGDFWIFIVNCNKLVFSV